ncbi:EAL domain-containing protein [Neiella marina]|uniref:EAL domain-containing protein n=1 Tax=Neiella holothuriorum TaxID=2870530 RepID=A0ABS7EBB3_9GAMM|nr:EAL domain-containing protein [Neiella holothuriorum]MBW8189628.1 EAL domain-containing protein [Neiella holothuriorum]
MDLVNNLKLRSAGLAASGAQGTVSQISELARRNIELLASRLELVEDQWRAHYQDLSLYSLLQPIVGYSHQSIIGCEALLRGEDVHGSTVMPAQLFAPTATSDNELRLLERLSRLLHIANFSTFDSFSGWLFINLSPQLIADDNDADDLAAALEWAKVSPARVVIELTEQACYDPQGLVSAVARYRALGCKVAIDDFGAGHSNFERIWTLLPDIVKLDRNMVLRATSELVIQQMLPGLVNLVHQSGSLVLAEGIETVEQAMLLSNAGVDMGQGYLFGYPRRELPNNDDLRVQMSNLSVQSQRSWRRDCERRRRLYDNFKHHIQQTVMGLRNGQPLDRAARSLLRLSHVRRCYVLNDKGRQEVLVEASRLASSVSPLAQTGSSDWGRRSYFRNAMESQDRMHISSPYLSLSDGSMCQTLSVYFRRGGHAQVLCCDIDPD